MIYLDNAATTWPKPRETVAAMEECIRIAGANPGRGGHQMSLAAGRIILEAREAVAELFNIGDPAQVVFCGNATEAVNLALKGFIKPGEHIITTSMEHNATARPLHVLARQGVDITEVPCSKEGVLDPENIRKAIKTTTRLIAVVHASNVTGTIMPVEQIGKIARDAGVAFMVDAAQTAGYLDIDVVQMNIDLLAFTGHKGLYGPQGTGGLYIRPKLELNPIFQGGTGSKSEMLEQPEDMPDKYESGTPNTPGIAGLGAGIRYIRSRGLDKIRDHEEGLMSRFIDGLQQLKKTEIYGLARPKERVPVVSINIKDQDSSEVAFALDRVFQIACRSGLHCAPAAHKTIGTLDRGTVRFSLSMYNTAEEIDQVLEALAQVIDEFS